MGSVGLNYYIKYFFKFLALILNITIALIICYMSCNFNHLLAFGIK